MTKIIAKANKFILAAGLVYTGDIQAQTGFYITPSLSIAALYDDNVLFTAEDERDDYIGRLTPEIDMGYESERLSLQGIYIFDGEVYDEYSELNDEFVRESVVAGVEYQFSEILNFSVQGNYSDTISPNALNLSTGLAPGRVNAQRASIDSVLTHQMTQTTEVIWEYSYINDKLDGGVESDTHSPGFEVNRQINEKNTLGFLYTYNRYLFDTGDTITSHVPMMAWSHQFNPNTLLTLAAGPRILEDTVEAEVAFSFQRQLAVGEIVITYDRTQSTIIGEQGTVESDRAGGILTYALRPGWELQISPYYTTGDQLGNKFEVYQFNLALSYAFNRSVSLISSYQYSLQEGSFGNFIVDDVESNVVMIGVRFSL